MTEPMLVYPTDKVVGGAPDRATLEEVWAALEAAGVGPERIEVLGAGSAADEDPQDAAEQRSDETDGALASVVRTVRVALGEEATRLQGLNDAIEAGHYVVQVALPDEDDEAQDAEKRAVGNALHDGGAQNVAFYGALTVEELQIGA